MIDTHTHLYESTFDADGGGAAAIDRALAAGVGYFVMPNVDADTVAPLIALTKERPGIIFPAMGLHPTSVDAGWRDQLAPMEAMLEKGGYVAVGEVGIDLYWDKTYRDEQMEAFARQIAIASRLGLPVIIHCREALDETLEVISSFKGELPRLIFHSFTLGPGEVERIRKVCDPWFGINGVVTYKNAASLREAIPVIGLSRLLLETDSPYLAPVPKRGRRNESSLLAYIRDAVAAALGVTPEEVEHATDRNAVEVFSLPVPDSVFNNNSTTTP